MVLRNGEIRLMVRRNVSVIETYHINGYLCEHDIYVFLLKVGILNVSKFKIKKVTHIIKIMCIISVQFRFTRIFE